MTRNKLYILTVFLLISALLVFVSCDSSLTGDDLVQSELIQSAKVELPRLYQTKAMNLRVNTCYRATKIL